MCEEKKCIKCGRLLPADKTHFHVDKLRQDGFFPYCKECRGGSFKEPRRIPNEGYIICTKCHRELPATLEYFHRDSKSPYGLYAICRECRGYDFKKLPQDGFLICIDCGEELPATLEYFYKNKTSKDGFSHRCKKCHSLRNREIYINNWSIAQERIKKYLQNNKEKLRPYYLNYHHNRRTLIKSLLSDLTIEQWEECKKFFDFRCCYCGEKGKLTLDHYVPVVKNGETTKCNAVPCCQSCNSSKNSKDALKWFREQPFYDEKREKKILKYLGYIKEGLQQRVLF